MRDEADYVIETITAFLKGSSGPWDWRRFTLSPLRDAELERIRRCAAAVELPLDTEGRAVLQDLLEQAELVGDVDPATPKPWHVEAGAGVGLLVGTVLWWVNYLPGAGLFHNLHLVILPMGVGFFIVTLRNSRKKVGAYNPRIVAQNKRGRV
ncbi:MAG TPA: hypothetical protein VGE65_01380 [Sphingobium sp.]